jgi:thiamine pyridinylase
MFFFEKKNQKTFASRSCTQRGRVHQGNKSLLLLFFRKEVLAFLCFIFLASAAPERRILHVSMYPYIPDAAEAALYLKQDFENEHPDVLLDITMNPNYYSTDPAQGGVLYEDADVHTIDVVFLQDFLDRHKLAELPPGLVSSLPEMEPLARQADTVGGKMVAVPEWMCTDFLFYRADLHALDGVDSLSGLQAGLRKTPGLLMDMAEPALGEIYLSAVLAQQDTPAAALARSTPDPAIVQRLRHMLAMEPAGFGRSPDYSARYGFYARQFARRAGGAFVGYSEMTHEMLDETETSCRVEDRCLNSAQITVTAFPFRDGAKRPAVWVDLFGIDARVHGRKLQDAADFIRFAVSLLTYRALLVPQQGRPPRYLLPATAEAFDDPAIKKAAPLYPAFRAIMEQGAVISMPRLQAKLQAVATRIDRDLPASH